MRGCAKCLILIVLTGAACSDQRSGSAVSAEPHPIASYSTRVNAGPESDISAG